MLEPLCVTIDPEVDVAYVRYRELPVSERPPRCQRVSEDIVLDFNRAGEVLGIELLYLSAESVSEAVALAASYGLALSADALKRV